MPPKKYHVGDLVRYGDHHYVVVKTNRDGKVRLLGAEAGAPYVRTMVAPTRVELVAAAPRVTYRAPVDPVQRKMIGELLRDVREQIGLSITSMAEALGVSQPYYSRLERGLHHARPSPALLKRFAYVTGADEDLLCATAGYLPPSLATALQDAENLALVRVLIAKLEEWGSVPTQGGAGGGVSQ
jgi:transcriptional regulator with XRE-family HTH domain